MYSCLCIYYITTHLKNKLNRDYDPIKNTDNYFVYLTFSCNLIPIICNFLRLIYEPGCEILSWKNIRIKDVKIYTAHTGMYCLWENKKYKHTRFEYLVHLYEIFVFLDGFEMSCWEKNIMQKVSTNEILCAMN